MTRLAAWFEERQRAAIGSYIVTKARLWPSPESRKLSSCGQSCSRKFEAPTRILVQRRVGQTTEGEGPLSRERVSHGSWLQDVRLHDQLGQVVPVAKSHSECIDQAPRLTGQQRSEIQSSRSRIRRLFGSTRSLLPW